MRAKSSDRLWVMAVQPDADGTGSHPLQDVHCGPRLGENALNRSKTESRENGLGNKRAAA